MALLLAIPIPGVNILAAALLALLAFGAVFAGAWGLLGA